MQICLCHLNVAIDLPGLPQIPAPVPDQSCAATSSANTLIGVGGPHAPPSCANLHSARRSRRLRLPFPAGSFIEGFRTPATLQAASLRSAGIRNPQQTEKSGLATGKSALPSRTDIVSPACQVRNVPMNETARAVGRCVERHGRASNGWNDESVLPDDDEGPEACPQNR